MERALDRHSQGAIATIDVARFYDSVLLLRSAVWLHARGLPKQWCAALLRFQMLPVIELSVASLQLDIHSRFRGSLTGSRSAGAAARIPVECAVIECARRSGHKGFLIGGVNLTFATYVDNIFSAGDTAANAVKLLDGVAEYLKSQWSLDIKGSSREVMVVAGGDTTFQSRFSWKKVTELFCLGHLISNNGSIKADWEATTQKVIGAFWANAAHKSLRQTPLKERLRLVSRCCVPLIDFRNTRWPPTRSQCKREDALQRQLIAILQRTQPRAGEEAGEFFARRKRLATEVAKRSGTWSSRHIKRCLEWREHLMRTRNQASWPAILLRHEDAEWLAIMRSIQRQGTGTRVRAGAPHARWEEAVLTHVAA